MTALFDRRTLLLGGSALALSAMSNSRVMAAASELRLEFWGSQPRADLTYKVTGLYKQATGTDIQGQFLGWGDYWTKLATEVAGGNAPDVLQMDYSYIVEYAKRQAIAPLDSFVGSTLKIGDFDTDQLESGKVGDKLYGISLGSNSTAMLINTAMWKEAGVAVPDRTTTWDDFAAAIKKVSDAKIRGGIHGASDGSGNQALFENWVRQRGKQMYTADGKLGCGAADITDWFKLWADIRAAGGCVDPSEQALYTGTIETDPFSRGKSAASFNNSNQLLGYQKVNKDPVLISNFPRLGKDGKGGHYRKASMFFSVSPACKNPQAAADFINFFVTNVDAGKILGVERGVPASAGLRAAIAPALDPLSQLALNYVGGLGDLAGPLPPAPPQHSGEVGQAFTTMSQQVGFGQLSPTDAGPAFVDEASGILSRSS
jgi:multiple sugar transport system substrate-binding protein